MGAARGVAKGYTTMGRWRARIRGLAGVLLLVLLLRQWLANPANRRRWDAMLLRLPLLGDVTAKAEAARFSRTLGTLIANGVPMLSALAIVKDTLVNTAYKEARNGFTLPGIGKLVLVNRKARMGRNPATGETIKIPAKTVVKFRVAKAAKDSIAPGKGKK